VEAGQEAGVGQVEAGQEAGVGQVEAGQEAGVGQVEAGQEALVEQVDVGQEADVGQVDVGQEVGPAPVDTRGLSRRDFFKRSAQGAAAAGVLASGGGSYGVGGGPAHAGPVATAPPDGVYRHARRGTERVREIPSICEQCFWRCGILGQVKDGELVGLRGNPDHPLSRGHLCARGNAGLKVHTDPDRLTHPLIRTGKRGEGRFRRASWDEALDLVATKMLRIRKDHGPSAMAMAPHGMSAFFMKSLLKHYSTPTFSVASYGQCRGPRITAYKHTFGMDVGSPERLDFEHTELIVLLGSHIGENVHTSQVHEFADALDRGAELVVVDPRFSVAASKAHQYLPIKPGTDTALVLAWIHVVLEEKLYDADYLARHAQGLEELEAHVTRYTPEWAARITELPAAAIREAARRMGRARPAVVLHPGRHVTWYGTDHQRQRAIAILTALLGSWGRKGGVFLPSRVPLGRCECPPQIQPTDHFPMPDGEYPLAEEGLPAQVLLEAMLTGKPRPVKGLMIYGQNVIKSWPKPDRTRKALQALDLVVTVDILPTEPTLWSDVVLPEASYLERYDVPHKVSSAKTPFVALRQPLAKPPGEARQPFDIARELGLKLGERGCFPCPNVELVLERALRPLGVSLPEMQTRGIQPWNPSAVYLPEKRPVRFYTSSGKIDLYSEELKKHGVDPLPRYEPPTEVPDGSFRLLYGRSPAHSFGRTQNNSLLVEIDPVNRLWINHRVARRLKISDGDPVELIDGKDRVSPPLPAKVTPGIRADCVYLVHGFGSRSHLLRRAYRRGVSDTELMVRCVPDPDTGATGMRVSFVRVRRARKPARSYPPPLASQRPRRRASR